jgi:glycosyltransferase involved in cell wall biosynthesis
MTGPDLNVLVLNTDLPIFPGGGGVEFLSLIHLARRAHRVGLVSMAHTRSDLERSRALSEAGVRLYLWQGPSLDAVAAPPAGRSIVRAVHRSIRATIDALRLPAGRPADTGSTESDFGRMTPGLLHAYAESSWNVLAIVQSGAAPMIDYVPRPLVTVLVMHDIRARLFERRAAVAEGVERRRWLEEAERYRAFEREYCRKFDLVVTVSAEDAAWVAHEYHPVRVHAMPLPVDAEYFKPVHPDVEQADRILFTGLMNHPPNVDAAVHFARVVLPLVRAHRPSAEFHVVGRNPAAEVWALADVPGVRVFPDVPDIRPHLAEAAVVVVPLRYGSGARQKILEAWSMERCVVSTSLGAEGLEFESGVNLRIADTASQLAEEVSTLLASPELRAALRRPGRVAVQTRHDPERLSAAYFDELRQIAAEKAAADRPIRVLLDMRWMLPGRAGGLENLARSFFKELERIDHRNQYTAIVPAQSRHDGDLHGTSNVRLVSLDSTSARVRRIWDRQRGRASRVLRLHDWRTSDVRNLQWLKELGVETAFSFPGYIHPDMYPLRQVLMVPDIQHEYLPELFSAEQLKERRALYAESARRADHICAISDFTRRTLMEKLNIPGDRITTIHPAADARFAPHADAGDAAVLAACGLQAGQYLFFPAHTWHHKNHRTAIEAVRLLRDRHGYDLPLVCTGEPREAQPQIDAQIVASGLHQRVRFLGYRRDSEMPALYRGAACLLFPSLFEGFGLPVLEAMASGCPVVCSNTTSLPEIAGDAALLVDPNDADAVAAATHRLLTDGDLRRDLVERGLQRASDFSWERSTRATLDILQRVSRQRSTR